MGQKTYLRRRKRKLLDCQNPVCFYCKKPVVEIAKIKVIKIFGWFGLVMYKKDDKIYWDFYATLEHLIPKRFNNDNKIINLVLSCEPCNHKKDRLYKEKIQTLWGEF